MEEDEGNSMIEERQELMVSPTSGSLPTLRKAYFLKPISSNSIKSQSFPKFDSTKQSLDHNNMNKRVKFRGMLKRLKDWKTWVNDLQKTHEKTWKKAGIFNAIKSSTYHIIKDDKLIIELADKWCSETNTFMFPWGECSITLEDVMVLGGFSVLGNSVKNEFKITENGDMMKKLVECKKELHKICNDCKVTQEKWLCYFKGRGGELEHVALLVLWLSRYVNVFTLKNLNSRLTHNVIYSKVFSIAIRLSRGTRIAFAPAVLGLLYRDLRLLKEKMVEGNDDGSNLAVWAPFHLVQVWAWERFPKLSPKPCLLAYGEPRVAHWHEVKGLKSLNSRVGIESLGDDFLWRPYALGLKNLEFPSFYCDQEKWVVVDYEDEQILCFAKCLRACYLVGIDFVERYQPNRVAMQFGLDQDLPLFVSRSSDVSEPVCNSYDQPVDGLKLYLPSRLSEGDVSFRYAEWWKAPLFVCDHDFEKRRRSTRKFRKVSIIIDQENEGHNKADGLDSICDNREKLVENSSCCEANELDEDTVMSRSVEAEDAGKCKDNVMENEEDMVIEFSPSCKLIVTQNDENVANENLNDSLISSVTRPEKDRENLKRNVMEEDEHPDNEMVEVREEVKLNQVKSSIDEPVYINDEEDNEVEAFMAYYHAIESRVSRLERMISARKAAKMNSTEV